MRTYWIGRTSKRSLPPELIAVIILTLAVASCGVKNDLVKPNGQTTTKDESDPSKPPYPIGR